MEFGDIEQSTLPLDTKREGFAHKFSAGQDIGFVGFFSEMRRYVGMPLIKVIAASVAVAGVTMTACAVYTNVTHPHPQQAAARAKNSVPDLNPVPDVSLAEVGSQLLRYAVTRKAGDNPTPQPLRPQPKQQPKVERIFKLPNGVVAAVPVTDPKEFARLGF